MTTHDTLVHTLTEYDRKQSTRRGYNRYALGIYLGALHEVDDETASGVPLRKAIVTHFTGRLLDVLLKSVGEPVSTDQEQHF